MKRIGVDVGGTFTDLILVDEDGSGHRRQGAVDPGRPVARRRRRASRELCATGGRRRSPTSTTCSTARRSRRTSCCTHTGAEVGLITTEGFRDILHIARHKKPLDFSLQQELPWQSRPLVNRRHRLTVHERVDRADGDVLVPLDEDGVRERVRELKRARASTRSPSASSTRT